MPPSTKLSAIAAVTGAVAAIAAIGSVAASMLDTAITSSIRNIIMRVRDGVEAGRMQQDRGPAQAVEQVEQHEPRPPFARGGERGLLAEEAAGNCG